MRFFFFFPFSLFFLLCFVLFSETHICDSSLFAAKTSFAFFRNQCPIWFQVVWCFCLIEKQHTNCGPNQHLFLWISGNGELFFFFLIFDFVALLRIDPFLISSLLFLSDEKPQTGRKRCSFCDYRQMTSCAVQKESKLWLLFFFSFFFLPFIFGSLFCFLRRIFVIVRCLLQRRVSLLSETSADVFSFGLVFLSDRETANHLWTKSAFVSVD